MQDASHVAAHFVLAHAAGQGGEFHQVAATFLGCEGERPSGITRQRQGGSNLRPGAVHAGLQSRPPVRAIGYCPRPGDPGCQQNLKISTLRDCMWVSAAIE
jgi:hypothetical protein